MGLIVIWQLDGYWFHLIIPGNRSHIQNAEVCFFSQSRLEKSIAFQSAKWQVTPLPCIAFTSVHLSQLTPSNWYSWRESPVLSIYSGCFSHLRLKLLIGLSGGGVYRRGEEGSRSSSPSSLILVLPFFLPFLFLPVNGKFFIKIHFFWDFNTKLWMLPNFPVWKLWSYRIRAWIYTPIRINHTLLSPLVHSGKNVHRLSGVKKNGMTVK